MRNFFVPHSTQMDRVAGRPFFMVTASMSRGGGLGLALDAVNLNGFGRSGHRGQLLVSRIVQVGAPGSVGLGVRHAFEV